MFKQFREENKRIHAIDFLKLFASILVIFSHCMLKYIYKGDSNPLFNLIWLTQMPLFMFASGLVAPSLKKVSSIKQFGYRTLKNALLLLFPCLTYMLFSSLISSKTLSTLIIDFYKNPESNLWFLWVLFWIHFFFDGATLLSNKIKSRISIFTPDIFCILLSAIIFVFIFVFGKRFDFSTLSIKLFAYYLPFFVFGHLSIIFLKSHLMENKKVSISLVVLFFVSLVILIAEIFLFKSIYRFNDSDLSRLFFRVVGSVCAIIVFLFITDFLTGKYSSCQKISKYGAFSLQSYYLHLLFIKFLNYSTSMVQYQWFLSFVSGCILIGMVIASITVLYFVPLSHLLVFGKSFSFYKFEKKLPKILR